MNWTFYPNRCTKIPDISGTFLIWHNQEEKTMQEQFWVK